MTRAAYLAIRDLDTDIADGRPVLPPSWACDPVPTTPAPTWIATRPSGDRILVVKCNEAGGRGLYVLRGDRDWLDSLEMDEVMPGRKAWRLSTEGPGTPRQTMRAWRWWRCDVTERATQDDVDAGEAAAVGDPIQRDGVTRELSAEGVLLPASMVDGSAGPWDLDASGAEVSMASAAIRVRAMLRPVLAPGGTPWTMAGQGDHIAAEDEPERQA
jgi:hypothetical protein